MLIYHLFYHFLDCVQCGWQFEFFAFNPLGQISKILFCFLVINALKFSKHFS